MGPKFCSQQGNEFGAQLGPMTITKFSPNWACQMGPIHCPKFFAVWDMSLLSRTSRYIQRRRLSSIEIPNFSPIPRHVEAFEHCSLPASPMLRLLMRMNIAENA